MLMIAIVAISNYLVQFPLNDWLTLAAFTYPISFLITELTNRLYGPKIARKVVYSGFTIAVILSFYLSTPKIATASGLAFLTSQLLDIAIFNKVRRTAWWYAPLIASFIASTIDSAIFWGVAFYGENLPILTWAIGDTLIKFLIDISMLLPFRLVINSQYRNQNA